MATNNSIGLNIKLPIYNSNGSSFHGLVLHKCTYDSVVMSLGDKITGDVYYNGNTLAVTMQEYVELDGVKFVLVTPPTVVREGMVSENSQLNGMTKYSFVFYHPMYMLGNFPFTDVAVTSSEAKYLSESKKFTWIGYPDDFIAKVNKNLDGTEWIVEKSSRFPAYLDDQLSGVLPFDGNTIADACKTFYDTWGAPYIVAKVESTEAAYANGKRFKVIFGLPSNEIYEDATHQQSGTPYIFRFGKGVGLKNNSRTPRGNKIVTRIAGSGSENNIPYGYPQIPWYGDSRWDYTEYEGSTINYDSEGHVTNTPKTTAYPLYMGIVGGAYVKLIKHPFTRTNLMPSIYGQTLFNKVSPYLSDGTANPDYDPNTTLIDYYDAIATQEYPYPNPIVANAPSYESHQFEDIKPELGQNVAIVDAYPVNKDMTPAQAWDDSMDDDGNYVQSYFKMQLPVLSFDLYACAAITQEMQINMRSGACLGCTFTVQVDWDDYKRNFYDEDGNFAPTGSQRDYTKYPDSTQEQITVVLQKETATFGTLMPNTYQYPVADDTFVVLGISLPLSYIESAEERLDGEMKSYMLENNVHYFDYPLKFDEAFLRNNPYILSQIKPNSVVRFQYGNDTMQLFVKQMTVKYGEGVLPKYDITLTDNVEVVLNRIGQVAEDVEKLALLIAILRQNYNRSVWNELAKKLSKTQDDTAAGYITMLKGLQIGANFVPDILGEGGVLRKRDDGKVELVTDILYARVKAYFDSVEIREYQHTGGNRIASVAGNKICRVAWFNSSNVELEQTQANLASVAYFRCYFRASDGEDTVRNNWVVGDQAYCHITSVTTSSDNPEQKGLNQKHLWRLVIGRNTEGTLTEDGEAYIDLSNRATETISGNSYTGYQSGSDIPEAQDDIIQLGNVNDTTRQGAIVEFVTGTDAPSYQIYQGINSFSLSNKNQIGFGYNTGTGRAYLNVFGDFRFGARPNTQGSYLEYNSQTGALNIKAHVEFTNSDQELDNLVQSHQRDDSYDDSEVRGLISGLQDQIDGQVESWFFDYPPVHVDEHGAPDSKVPLNVAPYSEWTDDNAKIAHLGDTFTDNSTGYCWRFTRNENNNAFEWTVIEDSAIISALQNAARAQDTADHKRRVFLTQPTPPYDAGDMWVNAVYPANYTGVTDEANHNYNNDILKCVTAKASDGSFSINDWALASKYTDDSKFNGYISALLNNTGLSGDSAAAAVQNAILGALGVGTVVAGGLLLTSLIGMRQYNGSGDKSDVSNYTTWAGISGQYNANVLGGGMAAWYGGGMLDKETLTEPQISQGWSTLRWAKGVDRFDGSGYRADGNISWNANGALTIKNITTLSDSNNKNILNELATFNSAFTFATSGEGSTTVLSITPQQPFTELYIGTAKNDSTKAATQGWVNQNFVTKSWFDKLFQLYNGTESAANKIAVNGTLPTDTSNLNIEAMFGFWTKKYISALGQGDDGSTSYTTLAQLNDVSLSNPTANQILVYDGTHWRNQNQQSVYELPVATTTTLGGIKVGTTLAISSGVLNLPTTGVTAGTYKRVTVDAYGRVTSGDNTDTDTNTWRNIYVGGTSKVGTGIDTKAINFKAGSNVSLSFAAAGTGSGQSGNANYFDVVISATDTTYSAATQSAAGLMSAADKKKLDGIAEGANNYSLPLAASGTRGGVQIGFTTDAANRNYAVQLSSEKMYVNVPWENTWRGIQNNLTSQSTTDSLSAYQGYLLANGSARDNTKLPLAGGTLTGTLTARDVVVQSAYTLKIGDAILKWDSANNALKLYKLSGSSEVAVNFYATGGVSALGMSEDGTAGAGDVTWALLASSSDTRQIALSHLTTALGSYATQSWVDGHFGYTTSGKNYAVKLDTNGNAYVNVPWEAGTYSLPLAANGTRGGIQLGYTQSGKNYPIQLSGEKAYVNVPWTDTTYTAGTGISLSGTTFSNSGVRAVSISGNSLRVNTNGTNADLTIPYATNAGIATRSKFVFHSGIGTAAYVSGDTHIMYLGYLEVSNYGNTTLMISSSFWGNQHNSVDLITIANDFNTNGDRLTQATVQRVMVGGSYERKFYCKKETNGNTLRVHLTVYVEGGNSYGNWYISIPNSNDGALWHTDGTKNYNNTGFSEIPFGGKVSYALNAGSSTKATQDSDGNAINSTYLKLSGGTLSNDGWGTQLVIHRSGTNQNGSVCIKFSNTADGVLGYLAMSGSASTLGKGSPYYYDGSTNYPLLHSGNSSVSLSGSTLTVKINGTTQSLTNTWRGITDNYAPTTGDSTISLSQAGALNMYNKLTKTNGRWTWNGSGQNAYCLIATINTNSAYINFPITFEINGRGLSMTHITVWYNNQSEVDPDVYKFTTDQATSFYLYKVSANTWNLYGNSSDGTWGTLNLYSVRSERENLVTIKMESVASLPTGYIQPSYTGNVSYATSAGSATQLTTARTLWGQSFNGTANVSGDMTSVGTITFSPLGGANEKNLLYQLIGDNDYFRLRTGATASNGGWVEIATADDGNEPIYVRQYTGVFTNVVRTLTLLDGSGNTSVPNTLSVGGALNVTGATTLTGLLTANGGIAVPSSKTLKIGDAYLSYDSTNNAIRVSKNADGTGAANFYAIGGVSALGQSTDGSAGSGDVTWALLAATDTRQINLTHITTALGTLTSYTTSGKNYAVQKDSSNHLFVNVPWDNTNTTYSAGAGISLSGTTFSNSGVRSTTINGNYLRVNTNGTNADLTIPYATNAGYTKKLASYYDSRPTTANILLGDGSLRFFEATSNMTEAKPTIGDSSIIHLSWDNNGGWEKQIAVGHGENTHIQIRSQSSGTWSSWINILDSSNSSVSKSGDTLTVKINGASYSLTNTNTTYSAGNGLAINGTQFSIASNVLVQGSVIDTHHEGNGTITLDGTNELYAFYDRGGTCDAYEVEQSATLTNQTLTRTSTAVARLSAGVFNGVVGYNQNDGVYSGEKFAVYDLALPAGYYWGANFFWSFGNDNWKPAKMRILIGKYSASGFTYISKYSSDACPAYGKVAVGNLSTGFDRLRIVVSKYSRLACFGITNYASTGLNTTYMNRCIDNAVYRNISPAKDNTWSLGTSSTRWKEVRAVNLYGSLTGNASSATTAKGLYLYEGTRKSLDSVKNLGDASVHYIIQGSGIRGLHFSWDSAAYDTQIYIPEHKFDSTDHLKWRSIGDNGVWENWITILDSSNSSVSKSGETLTVKINGTSQSLTNTNTTYSAGKGLRLSGTQFISDAPRVAKDSKAFGGANTWIMEEYTQGTAYNLPSNAWYHIMSTQGTDTAYGTQLALGMTTAAAYYRVYNNGSWGNWQSIINTWRGIQNNLTSDSTTDSLSAAQGKALANGSARDNTKLPLSGGTMTGHIYLGGVSSDSTANTTQIVFGTANSHHIALSSNPSRLIINASTSDSYNQVCLSVGDNNYDSYVALNSGNFGIGTMTPTQKLYVNGNAYANNYLTSSGNGAYVQIGAIKLVYDSSNNAIKVIKSDGGNANLYATGGVSALGAGQESGGGGNYLPLSGGIMTGSIDSAYYSLAYSSTNPYLELKGGGVTSYIQNFSGSMYIGYGIENSIRIDENADLTTKNITITNGGIGTSPFIEFKRGAYFDDYTDWRIFDSAGSLYFSRGSVNGWNNGIYFGESDAIYANGFNNTSDIRKKNVIKDIDLRLDQIAKAPAFEYYWLDPSIDHDLHVGTSAQYWQSVLPQVVTTAKDEIGTLSMQYGVAALISAITVARKVMTHEEKIALLETRVSALEKENGEQEQLINSLQEELAKFKAA